MDTIPAKVISTYPIHQSTGFKGRSISLTFDKDVRIEDVYNKLVITPRLPKLENGPSYTCKVNHETVTLDLETSLEEETTYTFNFKDAIRDVREKVPADNPIITFSTGEYVDSLYINGSVSYLLTNQLVKKGIVCLYKIVDSDTTHILNSKPDYLAMTNAEGNFKLENLKRGQYRVCAGFNKKQEIILNSAEDPYGFIAQPIDLNESIVDLQIAILQANVTPFKVQTTQPLEQYFEINFSKPIIKYTLGLAYVSKRFQGAEIYSHLLEDRTTIRVYNTLGLLEDDFVEAKLTAEDEMSNTLEQTVNLHFDNKMGPKAPFKFTTVPADKAQLLPPNFKVNILFNKPLKSFLPNKLYCVIGKEDSLSFTADEVTLHPTRGSLTIEKNIDLEHLVAIPSSEHASIRLYIEEEAFTSIEKEPNVASQRTYAFKKSAECGSIKGKVETEAPGFIIQLLDKNFQVVEEIRNQSAYQFTDLLAGNYRICILVLTEKEGNWYRGNINQFDPPGPVIFYPDEIAVLPNWEIEAIDFKF